MDTYRIAFLLTQSLDSPSGLGRYGPLARELAALGHGVSIFALHPDYSPEVAQPFVADGVQVHYVAPMHVRKQGSHKSYYGPAALAKIVALSTLRLTQAAWRAPVDILQIAKPQPMNSLAGLLGGLHRRKTVFLDCDDYEAGSNRFSSAWQRWGVSASERLTPRLVTAVTTHTEFMRQNLLDWGVAPERIHALPNGVDLQRFAPSPPGSEQALRQHWGLGEAQPVVLYVGSLSLASHAVDLLLSAFATVHAALPHARLLVVGGGEDYPALLAQAAQLGLAQAVIFTGRIAPDEIPAYYRLAAVSVDPVRDDPAARGRSPLKLFESWACDTPFVSADVGERRTLLGNPPAGILAAPGDPAALAQALLAVLRQPALAETLRQRGRARLPAYTWAELAKSLQEVYRRYV